MKKPKYLTQMYGIIFFFIGIAFIASGMLVATGIMHPSRHSMVQDKNAMTLIFCMIGVSFCAADAVLIFISRKKENQLQKLISDGRKIIGRVEQVQHKKGITFGHTSPYVIYFSYTFNDKEYHSKSHLIWEEPDLKNGDKIELFVNDFGKCAVMK